MDQVGAGGGNGVQRWQELAIRSLTFMLLLAAGLAHSAEDGQTLLCLARQGSFAVQSPAGWQVEDLVSTRPEKGQRNALLLSLFLPVRDETGRPSQKLARISARLSTDMVPIAAKNRWEFTLAEKSVDLPRLKDLPQWSFHELAAERMLTAYSQFGDDVLFFSLAAPDLTSYEQGRRDLLAILRSLKVVEETRP